MFFFVLRYCGSDSVGGLTLRTKSVEKIKSRAKVVLGGGWGSWCVGNER